MAGTGEVRDLAVNDALRSQLTAAYVAFKQITLSDIAGSGPVPGSVYYGYDPASGTYWAQAEFAPTQTAPLEVQVGFQDGGEYGLFTRTATGTWRAELGGLPLNCAESQFFPQAVLRAWSLPADSSPSC